MNIETKYKLIEQLMHTNDEEILIQVKGMLDSVEVIGYELDGTAITKRTYIEKIKAAQKRVTSGDFITQEDLEKEMEQW